MKESQKLFLLADPDMKRPLDVTLRIPEADASKVQSGRKAWVAFDSMPMNRFAGVVKQMKPLTKATTTPGSPALQYASALVEIHEPTPSIRPGMTASVEILVSESKDALRIPSASVVRFGMKDYVAVKANDGSVSLRPVVLGQQNDDYAEVVSGLQAGEQVASNAKVLIGK